MLQFIFCVLSGWQPPQLCHPLMFLSHSFTSSVASLCEPSHVVSCSESELRATTDYTQYVIVRDYWSLSPWLWCNAYVGHGSETRLQPSFSVLLQTLLNWSLWWITFQGPKCLNFKLGASLERLKQQWEHRRLSCTVMLHCCMYCVSYMLHSSCVCTVYTLFTWIA